MSQTEIIQAGAALPGVVVVTSSEANGDPEVSWGDSFFYYRPDGDVPDAQRFPFATIVTHDYVGFDEESNLHRDGVFRLNIAVGRQVFEDLIGIRAVDHGDRSGEFDYTVPDRVIPHPLYASRGWISILNPGDQTMPKAKVLLASARDLAAARHERRAT